MKGRNPRAPGIAPALAGGGPLAANAIVSLHRVLDELGEILQPGPTRAA